MKHIMMALIKLYQSTISRVTPATCRFYPTCSHYGYEAFKQHGFVHGSWLTINRISRCHPFNPGGYDPVPEKFEVRLDFFSKG